MNNTATGLSALDVLLIVNIVLKLVGSIDWSWWLVLWPLWAQIIFVVIVIIILTLD